MIRSKFTNYKKDSKEKYDKLKSEMIKEIDDLRSYVDSDKKELELELKTYKKKYNKANSKLEDATHQLNKLKENNDTQLGDIINEYNQKLNTQ